ncbi:MAG: beta-propeller fold lactonase family protein, partial [Erysipelotrichaceae bacterium]|nr:beta-propeller fold lactonase family protein [Erysipelotrichaceae bacterium]
RVILCGTYGKGEGNGIYRFFLEEGRLSEPDLLCRIDSAKYLAYDKGMIYAVFSNDSGAGTAVIDLQGNIRASLIHESVPGCFIASDKKRILCANYHDGTFSFLKYNDGRIGLEHQIVIGEKAGCHQIIPYGDMYLGISLLRDQMYLIDQNGKIIRTVEFPKGSGPRHAVISDDGRHLFVAGELSNKLYALRTSDFAVIDEISLGEGGSPAAVRLDDDGLIHVSVRRLDTVCVAQFSDGKLRLADTHSCGGVHPRDMIIVDGYEICANLESGSISCLENGKKISEILIPQAVSLCPLDH